MRTYFGAILIAGLAAGSDGIFNSRFWWEVSILAIFGGSRKAYLFLAQDLA
jgi:hypothetical protein